MLDQLLEAKDRAFDEYGSGVATEVVQFLQAEAAEQGILLGIGALAEEVDKGAIAGVAAEPALIVS